MIDLKETFKKFNDKKVLIIGDIMIDAYIFGSVDRISPEAPVPVLNVSDREYRLGGAGNVAKNIKALGATPIMCSVIGNDENAIILRSLLTKKNKVDDKYIINSERITTSKTRMISHSQQLMRVDSEDTTPLKENLTRKFAQVIKGAIDNEKPDVIIFEDYDKGVITPLLINEISWYAQENNIPTTVDPKNLNFLEYKGVTLFKPNFKEFIEGLNTNIGKKDINQIISEAKSYREKQNIEHLLITLSEYGVLIISEQSDFHIPAQKRDIADVSGAGDTVISIISLCLACDIPINIATQIANIAGGLVCEKIGVVPIDKMELLTECEQLLSQTK